MRHLTSTVATGFKRLLLMATMTYTHKLNVTLNKGGSVMQRIYSTGTNSTAQYFTGKEVEKTPAFGKQTLFVTKPWHSYEDIMSRYTANKCEHIFFGANHSFHPLEYEDGVNNDNPRKPAYATDWFNLITPFLEDGILCSLDIPVNGRCDEYVKQSGLLNFKNFIPQLRIPLPDLADWNANTTVKLDDSGFEATNPGVWCWSLQELTANDKLTTWDKYKQDSILS
jgi:hypothetical protein